MILERNFPREVVRRMFRNENEPKRRHIVCWLEQEEDPRYVAEAWKMCHSFEGKDIFGRVGRGGQEFISTAAGIGLI